jgi:hypothetical protein
VPQQADKLGDFSTSSTLRLPPGHAQKILSSSGTVFLAHALGPVADVGRRLMNTSSPKLTTHV